MKYIAEIILGFISIIFSVFLIWIFIMKVFVWGL
jgi:hypothetical protein